MNIINLDIDHLIFGSVNCSNIDSITHNFQNLIQRISLFVYVITYSIFTILNDTNPRVAGIWDVLSEIISPAAQLRSDEA